MVESFKPDAQSTPNKCLLHLTSGLGPLTSSGGAGQWVQGRQYEALTDKPYGTQNCKYETNVKTGWQAFRARTSEKG